MQKYFNILRRCALFDGISDSDLPRMLTCLGARVIDFDKKYTIIAEGSPAKYIGILLSGSAQIIQTDYYGNRSILSSVGPAEVFAEAFACSGTDAIPVSVVAAEQCEVMFIPGDHVTHTCSNHCGFHQKLILNLVKSLAQKTIMFHNRIEVTSKRTTREKLLAYLSLCAKRAGSNTFIIPFNRQELADYLEVDRSGLSVEISRLRQEGVIESHKSAFKLL